MKLRLLILSLAAALSTSYAMAAPAVCQGTAPAGDLTATRIAAANVTGESQGLYEGPVWIDDALYFSHFTFGPGFPSLLTSSSTPRD